jgi:hypothetical protein
MAFSYPSKLLIALTCGNCCALCKKTLAFKDDEGKPVHQSQAAHIAGEQPGAARYDAEMSQDQRDDPANGIYMCLECHNEIDVLHPDKYSTNWLLGLKSEHEIFVTRAIAEAIGKVTFKELGEVCSRLLNMTGAASTSYDLTELDKKIELNKLGPKVRNYITMGLALNAQVQGFIESEDARTPGFGERLRQGFLIEYHKSMYNGINGDALYESLINLAGRLNTNEHAAVIAVLAYLFEKCEVFEKT